MVNGQGGVRRCLQTLRPAADGMSSTRGEQRALGMVSGEH